MRLEHTQVEMTNKPAPVGIVRTRPRFDKNPRIDWVWRIPDFFNWVCGWVWGCTYPHHNTHPRHIFVPFKLLKYSQLIK